MNFLNLTNYIAMRLQRPFIFNNFNFKKTLKESFFFITDDDDNNF